MAEYHQELTPELYERTARRVNELYVALEGLVRTCEPVINRLWETGENQAAEVRRCGDALAEAKKALRGSRK